MTGYELKLPKLQTMHHPVSSWGARPSSVEPFNIRDEVRRPIIAARRHSSEAELEKGSRPDRHQAGADWGPYVPYCT